MMSVACWKIRIARFVKCVLVSAIWIRKSCFCFCVFYRFRFLFFFFFCHSICLKRIVPAASTDWYRCVRLCFRQRKDKKGRQKKRKTAKKEVSRNSELSKTDSFDDPFTYSFFSFSFSSSTVFFNLIGFDSTLIYLCVLCCVLDGKRIQKNVAQLGLENPTRRPD